MIKHTQGPWTPITDIESPDYGVVKSGDLCVANTCVDLELNPVTKKSEIDANARLIAAAPDLLEALEIALEHVCCERGNLDMHYDHDGVNDIDLDIKQIRSAIAKARGK